jgi:hypothetical protein
MNLALDHKVDILLKQKVDSLLTQVKELPQVDCEEANFFGPSVYIKQVKMPAGSVVIGKKHKVDHLCNMLTGRMILISEDGERKELVAPLTFMAKPGRKVAYILETVIFQNIYSTEETDIEKLENMFVETIALEKGN